MLIPVFPMEQGVAMGVRLALYQMCPIPKWDGTSGTDRAGQDTPWTVVVSLWKPDSRPIRRR